MEDIELPQGREDVWIGEEELYSIHQNPFWRGGQAKLDHLKSQVGAKRFEQARKYMDEYQQEMKKDEVSADFSEYKGELSTVMMLFRVKKPKI